MNKILTEEAAIAFLKKSIEDAGGQLEWAKKNNVSPSHLSNVLSRRRSMGALFCQAFGLRRIVKKTIHYERIS